jgi:hypothetical protein
MTSARRSEDRFGIAADSIPGSPERYESKDATEHPYIDSSGSVHSLHAANASVGDIERSQLDVAEMETEEWERAHGRRRHRDRDRDGDTHPNQGRQHDAVKRTRNTPTADDDNVVDITAPAAAPSAQPPTNANASANARPSSKIMRPLRDYTMAKLIPAFEEATKRAVIVQFELDYHNAATVRPNQPHAAARDFLRAFGSLPMSALSNNNVVIGAERVALRDAIKLTTDGYVVYPSREQHKTYIDAHKENASGAPPLRARVQVTFATMEAADAARQQFIRHGADVENGAPRVITGEVRRVKDAHLYVGHTADKLLYGLDATIIRTIAVQPLTNATGLVKTSTMRYTMFESSFEAVKAFNNGLEWGRTYLPGLQICTRCYRQGHTTRHCTAPKICRGCHQAAHDGTRCSSSPPIGCLVCRHLPAADRGETVHWTGQCHHLRAYETKWITADRASRTPAVVSQQQLRVTQQQSAAAPVVPRGTGPGRGAWQQPPSIVRQADVIDSNTMIARLQRENVQLRREVAQLRHENTEMGNRIETLTTSQARMEGKIDEMSRSMQDLNRTIIALIKSTAANEPPTPAADSSNRSRARGRPRSTSRARPRSASTTTTDRDSPQSASSSSRSVELQSDAPSQHIALSARSSQTISQHSMHTRSRKPFQTVVVRHDGKFVHAGPRSLGLSQATMEESKYDYIDNDEPHHVVDIDEDGGGGGGGVSLALSAADRGDTDDADISADIDEEEYDESHE